MVAKEYLGKSRLFRHLKRGRHPELVKLYAALLVKDGLADQGIWRSLNLVGDLLSWIAIGRSKLIDLDERMVERYLLYRAGKHCIQRTDRAALKRLLSALREVGAIAPAVQLPMTAQDRILEEFGDYLRRERGLVPDSVANHISAISYVRFALLVPTNSTRSAERLSPAISSATLVMGAQRQQRICAARCAHFSDTSIIEG